MANHLTFNDTTPLQDYVQPFEGYLYNLEKFIGLSRVLPTDRLSYYGLVGDQVYVKAHFFKDYFENEQTKQKEITAVSLLKSPFGSFEFHPELGENQLMRFINYVVRQLSDQQINFIRIQHYASAYQPENTELVKHCLSRTGFTLGSAVVNHHIPVDDTKLSDKIHAMEIRRLEKCKNAGFRIVEENISQWPALFAFVLHCRKERGQTLSLTFHEMEKAMQVIPEAYRLFSVFDGSKRIAGTIAVRVNSGILYNFFPASIKEYSNFSPIVLLLEGLYEYCFRHHMELLDLGTSISEPLRRFKVNMGGQPSLKLEFVYRLTQTTRY